MQELIVSHSLSLESNLAQVRESIAQTIAKWDVVVTEDRLPEAKELMATFNKQKKAFSDQCKAFLGEVLTPVDAFKAEQKAIEAMFDDGREKLKTQVDKFEAHKLEAITELIIIYLNNACAEKDIKPKSVVINDLIKLSAVNANKSGYSLSKATTESIDNRITLVEAEKLRAKLAAEEKAKREREIAEAARAEAEEKARQREADLIAKAERDKAQAVANAVAQERQAAHEKPEVSTEKPAFAHEKPVIMQEKPVIAHEKPSDEMTAKCEFAVTVTLKITTEKPVPSDKVKAAVLSRFEKAGFSTVQSVTVV
jgi:hypothetical protein